MTALATATGYFLAVIAVFVSIPWMRRHRGVARFLLAGFIGAGALAITLAEFDISLFEMFASMALYAFLCELFIFLFTLVKASISVAILVRAYNGLSLRATSKTDLCRAVSSRVDAMKAAGLIIQTDKRILLTKRGATLLRAADGLKRFLHGANH